MEANSYVIIYILLYILAEKELENMKNRNQTLLIAIPLSAAILLFGGFYSFGIFFSGVIIGICLFIKLAQTKKKYIHKNELFYGSILLFIAAFLSCIVAIDKGMSWIGFFRVIVIIGWIYYLMQFDSSERETALSIIPWLGSIMTLIGIVVFFIPALKHYVWQANRFGGLFQYSNTCGLFLLMGILLLLEQKKPDKKDFVLFDVLLVGIFLTGSKGSILLLLLMFVWMFMKNKAFRKNGIITILIVLAAGIVYGTVFDDFQNIARIFTLFKYPSTLYGRILYMKDALPVLLSKPFGIGYMGYASIQSTIQTGLYTSVFVHNDWMQMALDFGWLFALVCIGILSYQIIKGKQSIERKFILLLIAMYSFMEFHFQYLSIVMIVVLLFDFRDETLKAQNGLIVKENQILSAAAVLLFGYLGVASFFSYIGKYEITLSMCPMDTQAREMKLSKETDKEQAVTQAEKLLQYNAYCSQAYNVLAYASLMDGEITDAINNKLKVLEIERFNMSEYADFEDMIHSILSVTNDTSERDVCEYGWNQMQKILQQTQENVSPIAYKLRDKPIFTWE